jgi:hypothetical protein
MCLCVCVYVYMCTCVFLCVYMCIYVNGCGDMNMNGYDEYEWVWMDIWIWMGMNGYEWIWMGMNGYEHMNGYEWIWMDMSIWMNEARESRPQRAGVGDHRCVDRPLGARMNKKKKESKKNKQTKHHSFFQCMSGSSFSCFLFSFFWVCFRGLLRNSGVLQGSLLE